MQTDRIARIGTALSFGLLCHVLFAVSVGLMIFQMYFGMSHAYGSLDFPWSYAGNALLLLQFPLGHSFFLSGRGRAWLKRAAPAMHATSLLPTTYVIVAALQVLLLFNLWTFSGVVWWESEGFARWVLTLLYAASWLFLGKATLDAGIGLQSGAIGWMAVFQGRKPRFPGMPRSGLFRLCRQPIYLAFACTLWTVPVWTPDQLVLATVLTGYCLVGPLFKEARFRAIFGQAFIDYQKTHPYWLPRLRVAAIRRNDLGIYDRHASQWWDGSTRWLRILQNLVPARLAFFETQIEWTSKQVLDLGCGGGFMAEALARRGAIVTGIDPSQATLEAARKHARMEGLQIDYRAGSGERIPLPDASADCVVCVDVLEHVNDAGAVLDEIARVLRPGGIFAFDTINRTFLARLVIVTLGEGVTRLLPSGTHDPGRFITPKELTAMLLSRGFSGLQFEGLGPAGVNGKLDIVFGRLPFLTIQYMGLARRNA